MDIQFGSDGLPTVESCLRNSFFKYYFTFAVSDSFQSLYDNVDSIQDQFIEFWETVATIFKDQNNLLAYELLNEPWVGSYQKHPSYLVEQGKADKENLIPMYKKIYSKIRNVDSEHIVFYEPSKITIF